MQPVHNVRHQNPTVIGFIIFLCLWLSPTLVSPVKAQDVPDESSPEVTNPEATETNSADIEAARRMRPTFFEQERKPRFGFGDFLRSALDGEQNVFPDPAKVSGFTSDALSVPLVTDIPGTLTVFSRDEDSENFLNTDFSSPSAGTLMLTNTNQSSDPGLGTLTVTGSITLNNGQTLNFNNVPADYNAGFSSKGDRVSGVLLVTDPNNPNNSILIQLPVTNIDGFADSDDNEPLSAPASLSIGLPTDR
ncbi:hypothetical protein MC7420_3162 [Coleofasciculus chthonoplastes PCC 7420]|uniref:Uncharacterized protein n=1 Tax=Coleofasciculus chthonoplastes PCC 7420 TaxID=118168 RepID=B4VKH3_9CYAN|nr:hypothetical protein [Coleofasciculus chthonoplastes]EDX77838.1 hypothetical protein MC7420_3162 [Coleofasciculus chthonoplastes PCC 7420]